jgi:CHAT domain-containing protein/tetratricopeptide (TPR) repeat protein
MRRTSLPAVAVWLTALLVLQSGRVGAKEKTVGPSRATKPPWQRLLQGDDAKKAKDWEERLDRLQEAGKFEDALKVAGQLAALRRKEQGADHWQAVDARWAAEALRLILRAGEEGRRAHAGALVIGRQAVMLESKSRYKEAEGPRQEILAVSRKLFGEEHPATAERYNDLAYNLNAQGKYAAAEPLFRKALAAALRALGEEHPNTARGYNNLAHNLYRQGKHAAAEPLARKALAISLMALGEQHPHTARNFNTLASNLNAQGKYAAAEPLLRKALAIRLRALGEGHPDTARGHNNLASNLAAQGKYAEAEPLFRKALAIHLRALGEGHPDTAVNYANLALNLDSQGNHAAAEPLFRKALAIHLRALGEGHPDTAVSYGNLARNLDAQGEHADAEPLYRKALAISLKALGEEHPRTALGYNNLANNLSAQSRYAEAEPLYRKALATALKVLGEEHPHTAQGYSGLAGNLHAQGKYAVAEPLLRKALAIHLKGLGAEHPDTAPRYNNLAYNLNAQGKYAAAEPLFRKALGAALKVLGEEHPNTARGYNNLAYNLDHQGKHAAAELLFRKALAMRLKALGEDHLDTAGGYNNLASNLASQGQFAAAEALYRKALGIYLKALGEEHRHTAMCYNNLANNLNAQGKYAAAEPLLRKALAIRLRALGEGHPDTAGGYNNLASNLDNQRQFAAAEALYREALAIYLKALGEEHPDTVLCYNNLAGNLHSQGKYAATEILLDQGVEPFTRARLRLAASGLERAPFTSKLSPLLPLAAVYARNGKAKVAWQRFEQSLACGTWDDLSARLRRTATERDRQASLVGSLSRVDQLIERTFAAKETVELKQRREELRDLRRKLQDELDAFGLQLEKKYGPVAGQVFEQAAIQKALSPDAALVSWVDFQTLPGGADPNGEHWAVVLRAHGEPAWQRLRGSGPDGAWTAADTGLPAQLRKALPSPAGDWQTLAKKLTRQRLQPLSEQLAARDGLPAVRRLIVLPSTALAGVPVEVLAPAYIVSYAPSGTLFTYLRQQPRRAGGGLLAVADPVFESARQKTASAPLPPGGLLLTQVVPGSNAARARLQAGDVLLRYAGSELKSPADLQLLVEQHARDERVPMTFWRDGHAREGTLAAGRLGVVLAKEPAPQALVRRRHVDELVAATRAGEEDAWPPLPGTRVEAEALRRLCAGAGIPFRLLLGSEASEQALDQLAHAKDQLSQFRYLHLATHGELDDRRPLQSAVILARDHLPDPIQQLEAGAPAYDGRLTVEEILSQWDLRAELVTLSACQTALGKYERGEGFVGFTQALLLCGSRSVCLSLWKVDDTATALLMDRFYQNLLGRRAGLHGPLPKAEALAEARAWLRGLPAEEAVRRAAQLAEGVARGKGRRLLPPVPAGPPGEREARPFAHPYYWAAFVLIGDPD